MDGAVCFWMFALNKHYLVSLESLECGNSKES